jgi:hypothetical protein
MKKLKTQRILLFILICSILAAFTACKNGGADTDTADTGNNLENAEDSIPEETTRGNYADLPDVKMGGRDFLILGPGTFNETNYIDVEAETGDTLNDAAYKRNIEIEEKFEISIKVRGVEDLDIAKEMQKLILSGDDSVDLLISHPRLGVSALITEGLLLNWLDMEYIDFSKPWWNKDIQTSYLINNKLYYAWGDLGVTNFGGVLLVFNKDMAKDLGLESPYDYVFSGTWTIDKLIEYTKGATKDLNGNGKLDKDDIFGYINDTNEYQYIYAAGLKITQQNEEGRQVLSFYGERLTMLASKMYDLLHGGDTFLSNDGEALQVHFAGGKALISSAAFYHWPYFRSIEFDFGILPIPKLSEDQKNYYNLRGLGIIGIPINVKDPDQTGIITEALMEGSYKYMRPAFMDTVLYNKCLRDEESWKTMELFIDSGVFDFGYTFGSENYSERMESIIENVVTKKKSLDIASYYEKYADKAQKRYDAIYEFCVNQ